MQSPVQVSFLRLPVSDTLEKLCRDETAKLERHCDRITACRVTIAEPHRSRQRGGNLFDVRVCLAVPGGDLVINRTPAEHAQDEDPYVAVREAFGRMQRKLESWVERRRGS